jgi:hypothetical protein
MRIESQRLSVTKCESLLKRTNVNFCIRPALTSCLRLANSLKEQVTRQPAISAPIVETQLSSRITFPAFKAGKRAWLIDPDLSRQIALPQAASFSVIHEPLDQADALSLGVIVS